MLQRIVAYQKQQYEHQVHQLHSLVAKFEATCEDSP